MRHFLLGLSLLISACAPVAAPLASESLVPVANLAAAAGPWRHVAVDGAPVGNGYRLEFMYPTGDTFIASKGCVIAQGVLRPQPGGTWQVERYESGFSSDACGPFRAGPAVAPFHGESVRLYRSGDRLVVEGGGRQYVFEAIPVDRRIATLEQVGGRWLLADRNGKPLTGVDSATLTLGAELFSLSAHCDGRSGNGLVVLEGLRLAQGGDQEVRQKGNCDVRGVGDRLVEESGRTEFYYLPAVDRIEARVPGGRRYLFVRHDGR
jgi:hypothetical protein